MMPALQARRLTKRGGRTPALTDIELELHAGECVGIVGAPRSGRTTLLQLLGTLVPPAAGELQIDGIDAVGRVADARRRLVLAGLSLPVPPRLSVEEYVRFCYSARHHARPPAGAIQKAVGVAGLDARADVTAVSAAQRRNMAVAVAMVCQSPVVLIDAAGAAAGLSDEIVASILEMCQRGGAVVVSMDDNDRALRAACRSLFRLRDGRLFPEAFGLDVLDGASAGGR